MTMYSTRYRGVGGKSSLSTASWYFTKKNSILLIFATFMCVLFIGCSSSVSESDTDASKQIVYINNESLNDIFIRYNKFAEFKITPDMVQKGAYETHANVSAGDVWIQVIYNDNGTFIDYSYEGADDAILYPYFRDFCKVLNPGLTEDEIDFGYSELKAGNYIGYSPYDLRGIECLYYISKLNNGDNNYTIKTELSEE